MRRLLSDFFRNTSASIHMEYVMIALMVGVALIGVVTSIGGKLGDRYNALATAMTSSETTGSINP